VTTDKLQARKQQVVRDAIHDAAIGLFVAKGFDQTTVDEIAEAAGISRRSFFHYYVTKDDLLAQGTIKYGATLVEAIHACPATHSALEVLRDTVLAGIQYTAEQPLLRQIIEVSQASSGARQAYASRSVEIEDSLSVAYARHLKREGTFAAEPRLLAHLTLSIMKVAIMAWFTGEYKDLSTAARHVLVSLTRITSEATTSQSRQIRKLHDSPAPSKARAGTRKKLAGK
jgi:AcrR family transcriptional regulator